MEFWHVFAEFILYCLTELGDSEEVHTASHDDDGEDEDDEEGDKSDEPEEETPVKEMPSKMAILAATTPPVRPKVQQAEPAVKETSLSKTEKFQKVSSLEELENLGGLPGKNTSITLCILMDSSFWFDTISFGYSIVHI